MVISFLSRLLGSAYSRISNYFSFLLLIVTFFLLLNIVTQISESYAWLGHAKNWLFTIGIIYSIIYFFIVHKRFYDTKKRTSIWIGFMVMVINSITFTLLLLGLSYPPYELHI